MFSDNQTSDTYIVRLYTDSVRPEAPNHRLVILRWKTRKDETTGRETKLPARSVSIPRTSINVDPVILRDALQEAWETMQNEHIKSLVEAEFERNPSSISNVFSINASDITASAISTARAAETSSGGKLNKNKVEEWISETGLDAVLTLAIANAAFPGVSTLDASQEAKISAAVIQRVRMLSSLTSPATSYQPHIVNQLQKTLDLVSDDEGGRIKKQLSAKLQKMLIPSEISLGFNL